MTQDSVCTWSKPMRYKQGWRVVRYCKKGTGLSMDHIYFDRQDEAEEYYNNVDTGGRAV